MLRIVGGEYAGRRVKSVDGIRPTTERLREALFSIWQTRVRGARFLDLFCGSGAVGLEALSRGARSVVFFERDHKTHSLLKQNVQALGVAAVCLCWRTDILRTSYQPKNVDGLLPFDMVFFDPPYQMTQDMRPGDRMFKSLERLAREQVTDPACLLLLRTPARCQPEMPEVWKADWTLKISSMMIHAYHKADTKAPDTDDTKAPDTDDASHD